MTGQHLLSMTLPPPPLVMQLFATQQAYAALVAEHRSLQRCFEDLRDLYQDLLASQGLREQGKVH